jgi:hypothetical protein
VLYQDDGSPLTEGVVQGFIRRAAQRAALSNNGPHMLRHTFCSHLAMRGAPARAIQELAGHADLTTTQRYMHLSPAAVESAIRLLESPGLVVSRGNIVATGTDEDANSFQQQSVSWRRERDSSAFALRASARSHRVGDAIPPKLALELDASEGGWRAVWDEFRNFLLTPPCEPEREAWSPGSLLSRAVRVESSGRVIFAQIRRFFIPVEPT